MPDFQLFDPKFDDEQLFEEFQNFFSKYNLDALFTNEHRAPGMTVAWVDARSVVNPTGSYHNALKEFADYLSLANDNKSIEEALFKLIYEARTFQRFMMSIKKFNMYVRTIDGKHLFNLWNIVWYAKILS